VIVAVTGVPGVPDEFNGVTETFCSPATAEPTFTWMNDLPTAFGVHVTPPATVDPLLFATVSVAEEVRF
jgi:hypothetical protein